MLAALMIYFSFAIAEGKDTMHLSALVDTCKVFASSHLLTEGFGNNYDKNKNWIIYNKFISQSQLQRILLKSKNKEEVYIDTCWKEIYVEESQKIKATSDFNSSLKTDANIVRVLHPLYDKNKKSYSTIRWIKDKDWISGFHIYVEYFYSNHEVEIIRIFDTTATDILEDSAKELFK